MAVVWQSVSIQLTAVRSAGQSGGFSHRLEKITHPNGRITWYGYNTASADSVHSRLSLVREIRQTSGTGTQYTVYG